MRRHARMERALVHRARSASSGSSLLAYSTVTLFAKFLG